MGETRGHLGISWNYVGFGPLWAIRKMQNTLPNIIMVLFFKGQLTFLGVFRWSLCECFGA